MQRALVVDDSRAMRHYVAAGLDRYFDVEIAQDGADALEWLEEQPFDLVVSDLRMPRLDGPGLFRALRENGRRIPMILMTDQDIDPWLGTAHQLGIGHIFPKKMLSHDFDSFICTLQCLLRGEAPDLSSYLSPGGETRTFLVGSHADLPGLMEKTSEILTHYPRGTVYGAVMGLLCQHALSFGAPEGGFGPGRFLRVSVGADRQHVGISVRDPACALRRNDILEWLARPQQEGSRGWGLQMIRKFMDQCIISLNHGVSTEITCVDHLEPVEGSGPLAVFERE